MSGNPALKNEIGTGDKAAFDKKVEENIGLIMLVIKRTCFRLELSGLLKP